MEALQATPSEPAAAPAQQPRDLRMPQANKRASDMLNRWMESIKPQVEPTGFLRNRIIQIAIAKLCFAVVAELEAAYSEGFNACAEAKEKGY